MLLCNISAYILNLIREEDRVSYGLIRMPEEFEEIGEISLLTLLRVSAQGAGLYLYIPKDLVDVYGIMAGDRIEAKLGKIHRSTKLVRGFKKVKA